MQVCHSTSWVDLKSNPFIVGTEPAAIFLIFFWNASLTLLTFGCFSLDNIEWSQMVLSTKLSEQRCFMSNVAKVCYHCLTFSTGSTTSVSSLCSTTMFYFAHLSKTLLTFLGIFFVTFFILTMLSTLLNTAFDWTNVVNRKVFLHGAYLGTSPQGRFKWWKMQISLVFPDFDCVQGVVWELFLPQSSADNMDVSNISWRSASSSLPLLSISAPKAAVVDHSKSDSKSSAARRLHPQRCAASASPTSSWRRPSRGERCANRAPAWQWGRRAGGGVQ